MPGGIQIHGFSCRRVNDRAAFNISPQLGDGGKMPNPRKLSEASVRIAPATLRVPATRSGENEFGKICLSMIRRSDAPEQRAAVTYSFSRTARIWARSNRVLPVQPSTPIAITMLRRPGPSTETSAMMMIRSGIHMITSVTRMITLSTNPP